MAGDAEQAFPFSGGFLCFVHSLLEVGVHCQWEHDGEVPEGARRFGMPSQREEKLPCALQCSLVKADVPRA